MTDSDLSLSPSRTQFDNLKQVVDRSGTLRQLVIVNTNNPQSTATTPTGSYSKRKSKQIDSNNNNTNGSKNGLTGLAPNSTPIYGKCSPPTADELIAISPDQAYPPPYCCQLCYEYPPAAINPTPSQLNGGQLNGQTIASPIGGQLAAAANQMNTVPTVTTSTNATAPIYNPPLPLIDAANLPPPPPPPLQPAGQPTTAPTLTALPNTAPQPNSLPQIAATFPSPHHNSPSQAANNFRPFNLDNLLNNPNNNLLLKAAKNKLNSSQIANYGQFNGQTPSGHQFLLNSSSAPLVNHSVAGKLSPNGKQHSSSCYPPANYTPNSPTNGHLMNGHHPGLVSIGGKPLKESAKHSNKSSAALYGEEQPNKKPMSNSSYLAGSRNAAPSNSLTTKNSNKAKSIYSSHQLYPDAYHPHVHANQAATINYELSEKDKYVRKDKFNSGSLASYGGGDKVTGTLHNSTLRKRKDERFRLDKPSNSRSTSAAAGEQQHQLTNSSYKRFDEIKSNKSVDSPVTSSSPISEHYDFSSEESEANLPTNASSTNTSSKSTLNQSGSYSTPSPTAQCYSVENNCKLLGNRTRRCDETALKNSKNLTNNCSINYQTSAHYRQPSKDYYKVPRSASAQKIGKESLEQISKRGKEFGSKEFRVANKRKSMQEDDRDDGYVGDELDNSRDSRDSRLYGSAPQEDPSKRAAKSNPVQKLTSSSSASVKKQTLPSFQTASSLSQSDCRTNQNSIKAKLTSNGAGNKKPATSPMDQSSRTRRDELVSKETDLSRESCKESVSRESPKDSAPKEHAKDHPKDSQPSKEQTKVKEDKPVQKDEAKDSLPKVQKTTATGSTKPAPNAGQPAKSKNELAKLSSRTVTESKSAKINEETKEARKEVREEQGKAAAEPRKEEDERTVRVNEAERSAEQTKAGDSENSSSQAQPEQQPAEPEKVSKSVTLKQNEMPIVIAFNLVDTLVTSNLVRLKWTKNNGISLTNLDRPNYQIEMIYLKREENGGQPIKCSRIVQQYSQKSCKVSNLNSEQEYTFRVRLVYEEQLYLR